MMSLLAAAYKITTTVFAIEKLVVKDELSAEEDYTEEEFLAIMAARGAR